MGQGIRLGRIFGIEVRLDFSWFVIFFMMSASLSVGMFPAEYPLDAAARGALGVVAALLLFASVLVHELSHALVARAHGIEVSGITLFLFGGVAQIKGEPETPRAEFLIAGVGPVVSVFIGLFFLGAAYGVIQASDAARPAAALLSTVGLMNLALALFNLIPGFPLDGGRLLRSLLWQVTGSLRLATRWATLAGQAVAWMMIAYGLCFQVLLHKDLGGLWFVLIGWYLNNAARSAYQQLVLRESLSEVPVTDAMHRNLPVIDYDMRVGDFVHHYLLFTEFPAYAVVQNGETVGMVSLEDARRLQREYWGVTCVGAIAHGSGREHEIDAGRNAWDALVEMLEQDAPRLLVTQNDRILGLISRDSLARLAERKLRLDRPAAVRPAASGRVSRTRGWAP